MARLGLSLVVGALVALALTACPAERKAMGSGTVKLPVKPALFLRITPDGDASPIVENGKALSMVLEMQAKAWADAEPHGREVFLINQLERVTHLIVEKLATLRVKEVQIVDPGDGSALPNYVAGFPNTVTAVLHALRQTTGIDVPSILSSGGNGASTESAPAFMPQGGAR